MGSLARLTVAGHAPSRGRRLPTKQVAHRYAVTVRTIERWGEDPKLKFPKPVVVNKRKYFPLEELESWELSRAAMVAEPPDVDRLLQEISAAATRAEAEAIAAAANIHALDDGRREDVEHQIQDVLSELPE